MEASLMHCAWASCSRLFEPISNGYLAIYCEPCAIRMSREYPTPTLSIQQCRWSNDCTNRDITPSGKCSWHDYVFGL